MGRTIDVESIITHSDHRTPGPAQRFKLQEAVVGYIFDHFGWERWAQLPWAEPSPVLGSVSTSFDAIRFGAMLDVARPADQFPHLLIRSEYAAYYLPLDFETPHVVDFQPNEISLGSLPRLSHELLQLHRRIAAHADRDGWDTFVRLQPDSTWRDISDLCETLMAATLEGMLLNLPVQLRW